MMALIRKYLRNLLVAIDQLLNTILGGDPDETISSSLGKRDWWLGRFICWVLDFFDKNHCEKVREQDEGKDGLW